jgi:hypothetical protein
MLLPESVESLEMPAGASHARRWFWVIVVMSALQLLPSLYCPVLVFFLGFLSDDPANGHFPADSMLGLSFFG